MSDLKLYGTGRRKNSIARVFMVPGKGEIKVNGKPFRDYLCRETLATIVLQPLNAVESEKNYNINKPIIKDFVAAVSVGIINEKPLLDLDYNEDNSAQVDANFVICQNGKISEIQVTGEEYFFSEEQYNLIFSLAKKGVQSIIHEQKKVLDLQ